MMPGIPVKALGGLRLPIERNCYKCHVRLIPTGDWTHDGWRVDFVDVRKHSMDVGPYLCDPCAQLVHDFIFNHVTAPAAQPQDVFIDI